MPVFDIVPYYEEGDPQDMLVSTPRLGGALAEEFSGRSGRPDYTVVLMRRHGFTTIGSSIPMAVYRAIYTSKNAAAQFKSIVLRDSFASRPRAGRSSGDALATDFINAVMTPPLRDKYLSLTVCSARSVEAPPSSLLNSARMRSMSSGH